MFDKYILVDGSLRETADGFAFDAMLGYYRGLGLSMIEDLVVTIDGDPVSRDAISFDEGKGPIALDDMEQAYDRRWPFGNKATIAVKRTQALAAGDYRLSLKEVLRISYLPFPLVAEDSKMLTLAPTAAA